jgi:phospho-N-acetylmuramoyl-pentapeptide-transferase
MIRFALIVASTLGFVLTAALGNLMTPLLRAFRVQQEENEPPTMGGLCLMVGTLAAVGVGWTAACVAQPELLGTESLLTTRLLIALFGALCFGAVGLADDLVRLRHRSPLGLRRPVRLALEAASGTLVLALLGLNHCLPDGLALPGVGYCTLGPLAPVVWLVILVALAESARTADGMDGTVCGCAFIAMLGLMTAMTLLGWFPLGVLPAALAGALMAFLLWNFYPAKLRPGAVGLHGLAAQHIVGLGFGKPPAFHQDALGAFDGLALGQPGFGCAHLSAQSLFFFKARLCHLQDGQNARLGQAFHHIGGHAGLDRRPNAAVATIVGKHHDRVRCRLAEYAHLLQRIAPRAS